MTRNGASAGGHGAAARALTLTLTRGFAIAGRDWVAAALALAACLAFALPAPLVAGAAPNAPSAVQGAPADQAQRVLERYLTATGGRAAWEAEHTGHLSGRVSAFGLSGTIEAWTARPDRSASATKLGPFTLLEGMDGAAAWRTDPSGKLQMLDGRDLVRARASVWFENENYLASDHGGGQIRWIATEKDSAGTFDVLEITPPAGDSRRYAFDAATGLLVRVTLKEDQQSALSTLSDYRPAGSRKVAYVTHTAIVNMPANALTVTLDSIEVNVPVDASHFAPPRTAAPGVRWLKQDGIARLAFQYRGRHVWLRASINGAQPADFLFDTGASITILDSAYAAKMGIETTGKMDAMGAGSSGGASFATLKSLRVAGDDGDGVELSDQKIGVLSVNGVLAPFFWRDCAGVLGYGFISQFVNEIDFDADTLVLRDPKSFEYHGAGTMIPMTLAGTVPVVRLKLDGSIEGDYRLDVGSNSTVDVHGPFAKKHALEGTTGKSLEVTGAGFGGQFTSRVVRMKRIEIGPYGWDRPIVSLSGATTGALASEDYAGNIGNQILERFKCTLDYDRHQVYLEPGQKYREPDHFSRAGVLLIKVNGVVRAGEVLKGSPAASAGLRKDDEVLSIDGKAALSCEPDDLARLFEEGAEGRKVVFEIKRGDKVKKLKVKLKEMI